ncbi:PGRS family protein [Sorangium sp. So ce426]|uniref:PGRS family protein n=1 Tax=Sorangium sp. So ce426 TaxID=3133312 RepID=UPI003F5B2BE8
MRRTLNFWFASIVVGSAVTTSACDAIWINYTGDCELMLTCERYRGRGRDDVPPAGCVPSETPDVVDDVCGVFVSASGDDGNVATKEAPMKTLGAALALAEKNEKRRVYACAERFDEAVEVTQGVTIYGGLDCASGWIWAGAQRKTVLTAAAGEIPLVVRGGGAEATVRVEDLHVLARGIAPDDATLAGASSIAAVAEEVSVELARCVLEAGDAAAGAEGAAYETSAMGGAMGNEGTEACSAPASLGGLSVKNDCGTPEDASDDSRGGSGGNGEADVGEAGSKGTPGAKLNGGAGEEEAPTVCTDGIAGDNGAEGGPGAGATGLGEISASGFSGAAGRDGEKGGTAQGGGGGGGAKGGAGADKCPNEASAGGASGGSGGAGGCGGAGGRGGGAGGSSIALVSLNAMLSFEDVTLKTGRGGVGGKGGAGQEGGAGGAGGPGGKKLESATGLHDACAGGAGGKGGLGGQGGGGRGGHALGIAYKGTAPPVQGATVELGEAGTGGPGAKAESEGAAGVKAEVQAF